ncbi:TIR domain-containing protein [Rhizobium laguerreae]|uniref:TIR domain-containing protein n=1 Tax=Rhizobium laguerreae TaxID=1076926 RepID=UPI001C90741C|nr:TIR domain-containing protein [Rhizobium laguerreae]MBY3252158.1 TIR domain-containing protein [Rhizobium laguerreae]
MARRTFFSFHHDEDNWRAWNVRNSWVVRSQDQIDRGFFDSSVFEATKNESATALKNFLRNGLENTSVTCVLTGELTWQRRWVRYEIVRSVLKGNGLLTVDIYGVENRRGMVGSKGADPLAQVGLYKVPGGIFFAEWKGGKWVKYDDYTLAVPAGDLWFNAPTSDTVVQISSHYVRYDFTKQNGRQNIGDWIETAAGLAGR